MDHARHEEKDRKQDVQREMQADADGQKSRDGTVRVSIRRFHTIVGDPFLLPLSSLVIDLTLHLFGFLMEGHSHWIEIDLRNRLMLEMTISVFTAHQSGAVPVG